LCGTAAAATPTFYKDVAPILNAHCAQCHRPGQVAPMSLITYEQARPWAAAIKEAVLMGKMPPWPAVGPVGHFSNDWRLTPEQIAILRQWAEGHAPKGDPKEAAPAAHEFSDGWEKGTPDVVLSLPHEQKLAGNGSDLWKWILFDKTFDEDTWIRGLEIRPGNRKVVHHANVFIITPNGKADWSKFPEDLELAGDNAAGKVGGFNSVKFHVGLPGRFSFTSEPGAAVRIRKGSRMRINIHYAPAKTPETDLTQVGLYYASGRIEHEWRDLHCKIYDFRIPANSPSHEVRGAKEVTAPITVYQVGAHMHLRGKAYRIEAKLPDGQEIELVNIPKWDFEWQLMYNLAKPLKLPKGTLITYLATYDNSSGNPLVMKYDTPNRDVTNGERTVDEMMGGYVMHTVDDESLGLDVDGRTGRATSTVSRSSR
jgi:hypothetical protein